MPSRCLKNWGALPPIGYAQQAQLEVAYAYYKSNEQASAVAACDRFIKLHPNHANVDYAYYLKAWPISARPGPSAVWPTRISPNARHQGHPGILSAPSKNNRALPRQQIRARRPSACAIWSMLWPAMKVHVARYYYKRGAYVAAANRAQTTVRISPVASRGRGSFPDGEEL